jgi:hypothetical protein
VLDVEVDVVVVVAQTPASQLLGTAPTQALGLPQVDLEAQRLTIPTQPLFVSVAAASSAAQRT